MMDNSIQRVFFHWMFPDGTHQYDGILQLLLHFSWMWIGVICLNDDTGEKFVQNVLPMFSHGGICFDFIERVPKPTFSSEVFEMVTEGFKAVSVIMGSTTNVVVVNGEIHTIMAMRMLPQAAETEGTSVQTKAKVWIMTAQMDFTSFPFQRGWDITFLHGALSFSSHSKDLLGFQKFLQMRNPTLEKDDGFIRVFWEKAFNCSFPHPSLDKKQRGFCTGQEKLETLPESVFEMSMTGHSYSVYNAVYAVAHALHSSKFRDRVDRVRSELLNQQPWQLHHFLRTVSFNNIAGEEVSFDHNGKLVAGYDIINWVTFPNESFLRIKVGMMDPQAPPGKKFSIHDDAIMWPSRFNKDCQIT
ncbi:vomeronasal type-2 receptor 116-like [Rhineura floridana]|uniref:vomeronasal type-2 receptor 116-like n=1 Tax=Rhineura floridana TaxID=261503 RepID=UPI002AC87C8F|nr:vomeronasal type-2 receptor 116-like [Rhineura floridana]